MKTGRMLSGTKGQCFDYFICPNCNATTRFFGAPVDTSLASREILCKCGRRYCIVVNWGCRILAVRVAQ